MLIGGSVEINNIFCIIKMPKHEFIGITIYELLFHNMPECLIFSTKVSILVYELTKMAYEIRKPSLKA